MIILKPDGGLCNRIRAINSAYFLSLLLQQELKVLWVNSRELGCDFNKLFKLNEAFDVIDSKRILGVKGTLLKMSCDKLIDHNEIMEMYNSNYNFEKLRKHKNIYIRTNGMFFNCTNYNIFKPINEIQDIVDNYKSKFFNTIGIHIRRSDNKKSIENSPTESFIKLMNDEIKMNINATFYLSTDSMEEEKKLKGLYADRIITHPKSLKRNSVRGTQDALIDLLSLANTKKVIGSYWSSFTDIACKLNNIERIIASKDNIDILESRQSIII